LELLAALFPNIGKMSLAKAQCWFQALETHGHEKHKKLNGLIGPPLRIRFLWQQCFQGLDDLLLAEAVE